MIFAEIGARCGAMVDDAEHAARLEHVEAGLEHARRGVGHDPVVHVAERHDHVGRAGCAEIRRLQIELLDLGIAVVGRIAGELLAQRVHVLRVLAFLLLRRDDRGDVVAAALEQRREDFRVPATARREFDQCRAGLHAEELQRLLRMTVLVARLVLVGTPVACQHLVDFLADHLVGADRRRWLRRLVGGGLGSGGGRGSRCRRGGCRRRGRRGIAATAGENQRECGGDRDLVHMLLPS